MDKFDSKTLFSFAFSLIIVVEGITFLCKSKNGKEKASGVMALIAGLMFIAASAINVIRTDASPAFLTLAEWALYLVGFALFIVALIVRKKATK